MTARVELDEAIDHSRLQANTVEDLVAALASLISANKEELFTSPSMRKKDFHLVQFPDLLLAAAPTPHFLHIHQNLEDYRHKYNPNFFCLFI